MNLRLQPDNGTGAEFYYFQISTKDKTKNQSLKPDFRERPVR